MSGETLARSDDREVRGWHAPGRWRLPLALAAVLPFALPLAWLVANALKPAAEFYTAPPTFLSAAPTLDSLVEVWQLVNAPRLLLNTTFVAGLSALAAVLSSAVAGYAFAALPARGRRPLLWILLATIIIPPAATIVPQFILFSRLGWVGSYLPLLVPHLFGGAFYIFLFRQWFMNLPQSVLESAELDGANPWQAFRHIALPLAGPVVAAVAVFAFVAAWNDFLAPLVYLRSAESFTISLGMSSLEQTHGSQLHLSVALALIALLPPLLLFLVAQRFLIGGVGRGGWRA